MTTEDVLADPDFVKQLIEEANASKQALAAARLESDRQLGIAQRVHRSLLPSPVRHSRIDVDVRYLPIDVVGGNYCRR